MLACWSNIVSAPSASVATPVVLTAAAPSQQLNLTKPLHTCCLAKRLQSICKHFSITLLLLSFERSSLLYRAPLEVISFPSFLLFSSLFYLFYHSSLSSLFPLFPLFPLFSRFSFFSRFSLLSFLSFFSHLLSYSLIFSFSSLSTLPYLSSLSSLWFLLSERTSWLSPIIF